MTINHDTSRADALEEQDERNLAHSDAEPDPDSNGFGRFSPQLPLTDIDVREEETDDGIVAGGRIEFSTFCEGEYVESCYVTRERAAAIHATLGQLLTGEASTAGGLTPGPWHFQQVGSPGYFVIKGPNFKPLPETVENARLKAEAPKLLETINDLNACIQSIVDNWSRGDLANAVNNAEEAMHSAIAMLAKSGVQS